PETDLCAQAPLEEREEERGAELVLDQAGGPDRDYEEEPDREKQREEDRQTPGEAADLLLFLPVGELRVRGDRERPEADLQRLGERDDAADGGQPQDPAALRPGDDRLGGDLDLVFRRAA